MDVLQTVAAFVLQYALLPLGLGRKRRRVVFWSYFGKQYSCNPKYLSEYLEQHCPDLRLAWAFEDPEQFGFLRERGIELVRINTPQFVRLCLQSSVLVTNSELPAWLPVSSHQLLINTWHGGGAYKRVGADFHKASRWRDLRSAIGRRKPVVYLSSSKAFTELTLRQSFQHTGEVVDSGMPRNDLLVAAPNPALCRQVRERLGIGPQVHILLYAPTYREDREASSYLFDASLVRAALERAFGGEWAIVLRMHYLVMQQLPASADYIDASAYPDMQELLCAADVLVTDYSSSIWDFGLTGRPCFLYAPDLSDYDRERGFYSDIRTWPWPLATSKEGLAANITAFDAEAYASRLARHYADLGSYEQGNACQIVADYLCDRA